MEARTTCVVKPGGIYLASPREGSTSRPVTTTLSLVVGRVSPYLWGYKSAKSVVAITLQDRSIPGYWEVRGYPDAARIRAGRVNDVNTHRWRHIPDGEVIEFLD